MTGLPKTPQQWALLIVALVAIPCLDALHQAVSPETHFDWKHTAYMAVGGVMTAVSAWALPQLKSITGIEIPKPPVAAFAILCLLSCSCATLHQGPVSDQCAAIDGNYQMWSAIAAVGGGVSGSAGLTALPVKSEGAKDALLIGSGLASLVGSFAFIMQGRTHTQYVELCEGADTSTKAAE